MVQFLSEIVPGDKEVKSRQDSSQVRAAKYFSANKSEREEVSAQLERYGVGEAELFARSAQNNADVILMFERMAEDR